MRGMLKKWGEGALAVLCVLAIVFAALYTRQDDLRRMAARNAAAEQSETLAEAQRRAVWQRPAAQPPVSPFAGAERTSDGLWIAAPWARYAMPFAQSARAMNDGTVLAARDGLVCLSHEGGVETRYKGLRTLAVRVGESVAAGQALGIADGEILVCALRDGDFFDPESLINEK